MEISVKFSTVVFMHGCV